MSVLYERVRIQWSKHTIKRTIHIHICTFVHIQIRYFLNTRKWISHIFSRTTESSKYRRCVINWNFLFLSRPVFSAFVSLSLSFSLVHLLCVFICPYVGVCWAYHASTTIRTEIRNWFFVHFMLIADSYSDHPIRYQTTLSQLTFYTILYS